MKSGIIYISYSGMLEPLGQSQVLAYQEHLARGRDVHLISFERPEDWDRLVEREAVALRMAQAGIQWYPLRYHKRLSTIATAWDILRGSWVGWRLVRRHKLAIVHARSYISSVMALIIIRLTSAKFLFDMRGFWADERVDGGMWEENGTLYRVAKWFERRFLLEANHVVSLTEAAVREIQAFPYLRNRQCPPMTVIPTCVDLAKFVRLESPKVGFVLGYVGTTTGWYVFDPVMTVFKIIRESVPLARLLIINRGEHDFIHATLVRHGIPTDSVEIITATHDQVPEFMARMHVTAFFIKQVFSKRASAPTKLGEFLASGIPCMTNSGIGDTEAIVGSGECGVVLHSLDESALRVGVKRLLDLLKDDSTALRCASVAEEHFSLKDGVSSYERIYDLLDPLVLRKSVN